MKNNVNVLFFTTFAVKFNYHKMNKELITSKLLFRLLAAVPVLLSGCAEFEDYYCPDARNLRTIHPRRMTVSM